MQLIPRSLNPVDPAGKIERRGLYLRCFVKKMPRRLIQRYFNSYRYVVDEEENLCLSLPSRIKIKHF